MQNISRDCHRRVLPGKRHSGRTLYAKAQSEPAILSITSGQLSSTARASYRAACSKASSHRSDGCLHASGAVDRTERRCRPSCRRSSDADRSSRSDPARGRCAGSDRTCHRYGYSRAASLRQCGRSDQRSAACAADRRVAALPGLPRRLEAFSVWITVRHSVFLSVLAPIDQASYFLPEIYLTAQPETLRNEASPAVKR